MIKKIILVLIILLAAFLRFWRLGEYPALNADEAAIGYNAYSLIQTGKDEHGNPWPLHFQSFNDYKPGFYFYLVLPFVKFLGLNEWAVRLPGAILGVLTVLVLYFLVNELLGRRQKFSILNSQFSIGEIAAFFLAISPWHIHFSRGGWEVNTATFFITTGVWLFIRAVNKNKSLIPALLFMILSLYTYHAARIVVPLLGLGLLVIYKENLRKNFKYYLSAGFIGLILLIPLVKDLAGPAGDSRVAGVGLFADPGPVNRVNEQRGEHGDFSGLGAKILHNKPVNYSLAFLQNYSEHFSGEFLFLSGDDIQRNKIPETGVLYLFDILFVICGFYFIVKKPKGWGPILLWLIVAPIPASLTFQSPHALRAQNMVIPIVILSAYGLASISNFLKKQKKHLSVVGHFTLIILIFWNFTRYLHMYWVHLDKEYPYSSQYGVKELVTYVKENEHKYKQIVVTDRYDQPYILFLFYLKYPPEQFQLDHVLTQRDSFGFSTVREFDKYVFTSVTNWDSTREEFRGALIAGTDEEIFEGTNVIKKIYFPNGDRAFELVAN